MFESENKSADEMTSRDWREAVGELIVRLALFLLLVIGAVALIGEKRIERTVERSSADSKQWVETQRVGVEKWIADGRR